MLVCPKCHKKLRHIGVDYDRPAVVYSCNDCENSFTSPLTKATCTYCEGTFPVNALVPRDVVNYEITEEGIRALTESSIMFNNMSNIYDNFMEYPLLVNRLRRQLMETYRKDALTVLVGKIWILNGEQETVKIKDSLQGILCRQFPSHRVAYNNNNIFYISCTVFNDVSVEETQRQLSKDMSKAIRKLAHKIEPDELVCCVVSTKTKAIADNYDEFFNQMNYVELTPDDYCAYSPEELTQDEEEQTAETPLILDQPEDENDAILRRVKIYKQLVAVLITIAGVLILVAILALTILR